MPHSTSFSTLSIRYRTLEGEPCPVGLHQGNKARVTKAKKEKHEEWDAEVEVIQQCIVDCQPEIHGKHQFDQRHGALGNAIFFMLPMIGIFLDAVFRGPFKISLIPE